MTLLLTIGGGLVLSILAAVVCYRRGTPPGFDHLVRLIVVSFSLSGFFATTAIPGFWLAISTVSTAASSTSTSSATPAICWPA